MGVSCETDMEKGKLIQYKICDTHLRSTKAGTHILYDTDNYEIDVLSTRNIGEEETSVTKEICHRRGEGSRTRYLFSFINVGVCNLNVLAVIMTFIILGSCVDYADSSPVGSYSKTENWYREREFSMVKYLGQFGYLTDASRETGPAGLTSKDVYVSSLKRLQRWGNIPETGVVDLRTYELMNKPRCGVKDDLPSLTRRRRKRYITAPSKWEKNHLTFSILNTTPDMSEGSVRRAITGAFKVWSDVTPLTFTQTVNRDADILIQFAEDYHHDGYPFDGKGSVLAHAFFPGTDRGGDTHFDDAETWTFNSTEGVDLFMVAAHEFGHALGLAHSSNTEALMYPWYQGYQDGFKLPYDDVAGIQSIYGGKSDGRLPPIVTPRPTRRPTHTDRPGYTVNPPHRPPYRPPVQDINPCNHSIDAITVIRTEVFIFIGPLFWRLGSNGIRGTASHINKFWYNLPEDGIDAIFERADGKIVFFKGDRFWVFSSNRMVSNFPKEGKRITELGIDKDVKKIDAVFVWAYNKRTYLVTGDMYWKLNDKDEYIEYDYPRDMSIWRNVPVPLDSSFQHFNGKTYFLKGTEYWEFHDNKMKTRRKEGRPISKLLGCRDGVLVRELKIETEDDEKADRSSASRAQVFLSNLVVFVSLYHWLH